MKNSIYFLLICIILVLVACSDKKNKSDDIVIAPDEEIPNVITLSKTASINDVRISSDNIFFDELTLNGTAIYAISFINDNTRYPALISFKQIPADIKLDKLSTCKLEGNIILPSDSCVAIFNITPTGKTPLAGSFKYTDGVNSRAINYSVANINEQFTVKSDSYSSLFVSTVFGEQGDIANFNILNSTSQNMKIEIPSITDGFLIYPLSECKEGANVLPPGGGCKLSVIMNTPLQSAPYNALVKVKTYTSSDNSSTLNNINIALAGFYKENYNETIDNLSVSTSSLDFGITLDDIKISRTFTIENRSPNNKIKFQIESPTDNFTYDISSTCGINGGILERGVSCDYKLYFTPKTVGIINDGIKVYVNANSKTIMIKANNDENPLISLSNKWVDFGLIDSRSVTTRYIDIKNISTTDARLNFENLRGLKIDTSSLCTNDTLLQPNAQCRLTLLLDDIADIPQNITLNRSGIRYDIPINYNITYGSSLLSTQLGDYDIISSSVGEYDNRVLLYKMGSSKVLSLYDPMMNNFEDLKPLSQDIAELDNATITRINDIFYIFGGIDNASNRSNKLYSYDISSKQFKNLLRQTDGLPEPRDNAIMLAIDSVLYLYGGVGDGGAVFDDIYLLDLTADNRTWVNILPNSSIANKEQMRLGFVKDKIIYLLSDKALYSYNYNAGATSLTKVKNMLHVDVANASLSVMDYVVYAYGAKVAGVATTDIYAFDFTKDDWFKKVDIRSAYKPAYYDKAKLLSLGKKLYLITTSTDRVVAEKYLLDTTYRYFSKQQSDIGLRVLSDNATSTILSDKVYYFDNGKVIYFDINSSSFNQVDTTGILPNDKYVAVAVEDKIYLLGSLSDEFYIYDPMLASFTHEAKSADSVAVSLRRGYNIVYSVANDKIYLYGGADRASGIVLSDMFSYDIANKKWEAITALGNHPDGLYSYSSAVLGEKIYIAGGKKNSADNSSKLYQYDIATATFVELLDDISLSGGYCKILVVDNIIYIAVNENLKRYDMIGNTLADVDIFGDDVLVKDAYLSVVYDSIVYTFNKSSSKFDKILLKN